MRTAPLLISLAVGYAVLVFARREARPLDLVGKVIGWIIVVVSFIGLLCIAASSACRMCPFHRNACAVSSYCPYMNHGGVSCVPLESMQKDGNAPTKDAASESSKSASPAKK